MGKPPHRVGDAMPHGTHYPPANFYPATKPTCFSESNFLQYTKSVFAVSRNNSWKADASAEYFSAAIAYFASIQLNQLE
jgi:hypothetical protein